MAIYRLSRASATRPFIVAAYLPGDRELRPELPGECPYGHVAGEGCHVVLDHWRARKTGPEIPLLVARCRVHEVAFTVYPPGHVPYGRAAAAPARPEGTEAGSWGDTLFRAALDAAEGVAWSRSALGPAAPGSWATQLRRIEVAVAILGLASDCDQPAWQVIAAALQVPGLVVAEAAREVQAAKGFQGRGRAVSAVLREVPAPTLQRVLAAGHLAGRWGEPFLGKGGRLRSLAFRGAARGPPGEQAPRGR